MIIPWLKSTMVMDEKTVLWLVCPCRVDVSPIDVSLTENSWMLRPLNKASLGYYAPDRCVPTLDRVTH